MQESDFEIIDIKKEFENHEFLWKNCMNYLKTTCYRDQLYRNYLHIDLEKFLTLTAIVYQNEIISFGGVEIKKDRWGEHIARALTRFWINPKYRSESLTKWRNSTVKFSPIILRHQLAFIKEIGIISASIITREGNYKNSFLEIIRLANTVSEEEFFIMPGKYNVCECMENPPESCKQFVAINNLDSFHKAQEDGFFRLYE